MRIIIKNVSLLILFFGSFYITNNIALYVKNKDPIMQAIYQQKDNYAIKPVNALINNDYITPGLNGTTIDVNSSFRKMKSVGDFNKNYVVLQSVKPEISVSNNLDKIINSGNKNKKMISLIVDNDVISNYLCDNNIAGNKIVSKDESRYCLEPIIKDHFADIYYELKRLNINHNLCYVSKDNNDICIKNKQYLILNNKSLNKSNFISLKNDITAGDFIYISPTANLSDVILLINYVQSKDLTLASISEHIKE